MGLSSTGRLEVKPFGEPGLRPVLPTAEPKVGTESNRNVPVQLGDDLAHGLSSSGGGGDDVLGGTTSVPPQLTRGTIHGLLCGSDGVDCALEEGQQEVT